MGKRRRKRPSATDMTAAGLLALLAALLPAAAAQAAGAAAASSAGTAAATQEPLTPPYFNIAENRKVRLVLHFPPRTPAFDRGCVGLGDCERHLRRGHS